MEVRISTAIGLGMEVKKGNSFIEWIAGRHRRVMKMGKMEGRLQRRWMPLLLLFRLNKLVFISNGERESNTRCVQIEKGLAWGPAIGCVYPSISSSKIIKNDAKKQNLRSGLLVAPPSFSIVIDKNAITSSASTWMKGSPWTRSKLLIIVIIIGRLVFLTSVRPFYLFDSSPRPPLLRVILPLGNKLQVFTRPVGPFTRCKWAAALNSSSSS